MEQPRMLVCFAHPDDEAFPVGGTLAAYATHGADIHLVCATLGEEGEIRQPGVATRETLAQVRHQELQCSCEALGIRELTVLGYRDSGMAGSAANRNPRAFINADAREVVQRLIEEMDRFKPQVVLTFGSDGLYGHPDHITISKHATAAFFRSSPTPLRLFYSVRPRGFRMEMALKLRQAGVDTHLPDEERQYDGVPQEQIHIEVDVSPHIEKKVTCLICHRSQMSPQRPYHKLPNDVVADIIGREHFVRAYPPVGPDERVPPDFFQGISVPD